MAQRKYYNGKFINSNCPQFTVVNEHEIRLFKNDNKSAMLDTPINIGKNEIYCWQIMMDCETKLGTEYEMFGVVSDKCNNIGDPPWTSLIDAYGISAGDKCVYKGAKGRSDPKYTTSIKKGQVVWMELNCKSSEIIFKLEGKTIYGPMKLPNRESWYPAIVCEYGKSRKYTVKLIPITSISVEEKKQNNEMESLQKEINKLTDENIKSAQLISRLQKENEQINDQTVQSTKRISLLEQQIQEKQEEVEILKSTKVQSDKMQQTLMTENSSLKMEKEKMSKIIEDLENEKKEMEMELVELREEVKCLKLQNINPNEYKKWNWEEIVVWIISLDDAYKVYENKLKISLKEQNIDGMCFSEIDGSDIMLWGIVDFRHRKAILKHIQLLVNKDKGDIVRNVEGTNPPTAYI